MTSVNVGDIYTRRLEDFIIAYDVIITNISGKVVFYKNITYNLGEQYYNHEDDFLNRFFLKEAKDTSPLFEDFEL